MTQPQAELFDLYRAGLKTVADLMKTSLESAERLQNQQLVVIRSAIDESSKSASELSSARTIDELLALQTKLAGAQFERAISYWGELVQITTENQRKAISKVQENARWLSDAGVRQGKAEKKSA